MCSINFIYTSADTRSLLDEAILRMTTASKHRGPDATSVIMRKESAIGFNRLEIVGGLRGGQPIYDELNQIILICNGEIFNHAELKQQYCSDEQFLGSSDVEIILHLYQKFGTDFCNYLEGQFAFLIYDIRHQKIIMARDKFGINPLFYYLDSKHFIVSSEIKSILASGISNNIGLDAEALAESFFLYGSVPPKTSFSGVKQIPPASYAAFDMSLRSIEVNTYWLGATSQKCKLPENEAVHEVRSTLDASVQKRLQGDSAVGVYLSGGLDSSIIASIASRVSGRPIKLFSIAFQDAQFDESPYQDDMARHLHSPLKKVIINTEDIVDNLEKCVYHTETPLIRTAPIPMYLLSYAAQEAGVKFVLCGEGADEIFAGYPVFQAGRSSIEEKFEGLAQYLDIFKNKDTFAYIRKQYEGLTKSGHAKDVLGQIRQQEINTKLSQYLLVCQGDRVSMANGIEQRFPFLDGEVVSTAFSLEDTALLRDSEGKVILRDAFRHDLPLRVALRKKQGYLAPDTSAVSKILMSDAYSELLKKEFFERAGVFDYKACTQIIKRVMQGTTTRDYDANVALFIVTTHLLHRIFLSR